MEKAIKVVSGPQSEAQKNRGRIGLLKVAMNYPQGSRSRNLIIEQVARSCEVVYIEDEHYKAIYNVFENETFGGTEDIDREFELYDAGLDATLKVGAVAYDGQYGIAYSFYNVELATFIDGGREVPNDFDMNRFIDIYQCAS